MNRVKRGRGEGDGLRCKAHGDQVNEAGAEAGQQRLENQCGHPTAVREPEDGADGERIKRRPPDDAESRQPVIRNQPGLIEKLHLIENRAAVEIRMRPLMQIDEPKGRRQKNDGQNAARASGKFHGRNDKLFVTSGQAASEQQAPTDCGQPCSARGFVVTSMATIQMSSAKGSSSTNFEIAARSPSTISLALR